MKKRLERFGEVRIVDETNGFVLDIKRRTDLGPASSGVETKL